MNRSTDYLLMLILDHKLLMILSLALVAVVFFSFGWLFSKLKSMKKISTLETMLEYEINSAKEKVISIQDSFASLSGEALRNNNQQFMDLAQQILQNHTQKAEQNFKIREQAVKNMIRPIQDSLSRVEKQFQQSDQDRRRVHNELSMQLKTMSANQHVLEQEARNLVKALSRPEIRGKWGEISLRRIVELSGMTHHCDFIEQTTLHTEDGILRPDMVIQLPGHRQIVIDVKTPLDAYINAVNIQEEKERIHYLNEHALQVKARIKALSTKKYWAQFSHSPDFVVLFIPGDQFLNAALEIDQTLIEYAMQKKIVLATPTSLIALLRTIAYGWKQEQLNDHAMEIREMAEQYHQRLATFSEHLYSLGDNLQKTVNYYNKSIGSYRKNVMSIAKKFAALGLHKNKEIQNPDEIADQLSERKKAIE